MRSILPSAPFRLTGVSLVVIGLVLACAGVNTPAGPSSTSYPTITITANGISNTASYLIPGMAVKVVNADSVAHRLHPNLNEPQGCASIDSGDIAPGQSQLTGPVSGDVTSCSVHDHLHHGDPRFQITLSVDPGQ